MKTINFFCLVFIFSTCSKLYSQAGDQYLGQIMWVPFNFAPKGWAECNGQILPIAQNTALFSLLGTQYGGNGQTTFALPDMRGRAIIGSGNGPGLTPVNNGDMTGLSSVTLINSEMPAHTHTVNTVNIVGNQNLPIGNLPANTNVADPEYSDKASNTSMNVQMIQTTGQSQPHNNMQPFLTLKCVIALQGVFPPRD